MALLKISCPECKAALKSAKGFTPGQTVCCPKCETYFSVEAEEPEEVEDAEVAETTPKTRATKPAVADDDDDVKPAKKKKKKRDSDDDDEFEKRSYKDSPIRFVVLGVLIVIMLVLAYFLYEKRQREMADNNNDNRENNGLIPNTEPIPPPPGGINNPGAPKLPGGNNPRPKLPGIPGIPPPPNPNPNPNPKLPNPKGPGVGGGIGAGMLNDLLSGSGPRTPAEATALTTKYKAAIVGTWNADLGKGVTQELVYKNDGTFTAKLTGGTNATASGTYIVAGLSGTKGLKLELTSAGNTRKVTAVFEDDELQHPSLEPGVTATFRKK